MVTYSRKRAWHDINTTTTEPPYPSPTLPALTPLHPNKLLKLSQPSRQSRTPAQTLTQTTISLNIHHNPQRTCKACGMPYLPSSAEDVASHRRYHNANVGGVDVPAGAMKDASVATAVERKSKTSKGTRGAGMLKPQQDLVLEVCRRSSRPLRGLAKKVLAVAERELGAVPTGEADLWGVVAEPGRAARTTTPPDRGGGAPRLLGERAGSFRERHKVYLCVRGGKCIALCLAERIYRARAVLSRPEREMGMQDRDAASALPSPPPSSPPPHTAAPPHEPLMPVTARLSSAHRTARLGISRIWVSRDCRGVGIATHLLDAACAGMEGVVGAKRGEKGLVAFSQPTEGGTRLAERWSGREVGWMVYDEGDLGVSCAG